MIAFKLWGKGAHHVLWAVAWGLVAGLWPHTMVQSCSVYGGRGSSMAASQLARQTDRHVAYQQTRLASDCTHGAQPRSWLVTNTKTGQTAAGLALGTKTGMLP